MYSNVYVRGCFAWIFDFEGGSRPAYCLATALKYISTRGWAQLCSQEQFGRQLTINFYIYIFKNKLIQKVPFFHKSVL